MNKLALTFIFITALLDSIGFGIIMPVMPGLLMEITGEDLSTNVVYVGWLMFVFAIMQFFFAPIIGNLSDRFGRRPVLLMSLAVVGINLLIMGLATSLFVLFIGRVISGIGASTMSTCNAYIADITPEDKRAQNFGLIGAAFGMGFVIGPALGGFIGEYGSRMPFFAAAVLSLANMLFGYFVLKESLSKSNRRPFDVKRANPLGALIQLKSFPIVIGIISVMFIYNLGHHALPSTWSFWGAEQFNWGPKEIGYSLTFIGICMVAVQGFLIRLVLPITGLRVAGIIGMMFAVVAFLGYGYASLAWMAYAAMIPGALSALCSPAMQGIASGQVGASQQGELQGGMSSMMSLTSIVSPLMMTQTFSFFTQESAPIYFPGAAFLLSAGLSLIALVMFIRVTRGWQPNTAKTSQTET